MESQSYHHCAPPSRSQSSSDLPLSSSSSLLSLSLLSTARGVPSHLLGLFSSSRPEVWSTSSTMPLPTSGSSASPHGAGAVPSSGRPASGPSRRSLLARSWAAASSIRRRKPSSGSASAEPDSAVGLGLSSLALVSPLPSPGQPVGRTVETDGHHNSDSNSHTLVQTPQFSRADPDPTFTPSPTAAEKMRSQQFWAQQSLLEDNENDQEMESDHLCHTPTPDVRLNLSLAGRAERDGGELDAPRPPPRPALLPPVSVRSRIQADGADDDASVRPMYYLSLDGTGSGRDTPGSVMSLGSPPPKPSTASNKPVCSPGPGPSTPNPIAAPSRASTPNPGVRPPSVLEALARVVPALPGPLRQAAHMAGLTCPPSPDLEPIVPSLGFVSTPSPAPANTVVVSGPAPPGHGYSSSLSSGSVIGPSAVVIPDGESPDWSSAAHALRLLDSALSEAHWSRGPTSPATADALPRRLLFRAAVLLLSSLPRLTASELSELRLAVPQLGNPILSNPQTGTNFSNGSSRHIQSTSRLQTVAAASTAAICRIVAAFIPIALMLFSWAVRVARRHNLLDRAVGVMSVFGAAVVTVLVRLAGAKPVAGIGAAIFSVMMEIFVGMVDGLTGYLDREGIIILRSRYQLSQQQQQQQVSHPAQENGGVFGQSTMGENGDGVNGTTANQPVFGNPNPNGQPASITQGVSPGLVSLAGLLAVLAAGRPVC